MLWAQLTDRCRDLTSDWLMVLLQLPGYTVPLREARVRVIVKTSLSALSFISRSLTKKDLLHHSESLFVFS